MMLVALLRSRCRARRSERGAAFVEAVIVLPFIISLMLATFEIGMGWRAQMTVSNAARSGARVASNESVDPYADYTALAAVASGLGSINDLTVNWVTIYKVTGTDITPPAACISASGVTNHGSSSSSCNTYSGAELAAVAGGSQSGFGNCSSGSSKDKNWCPTARVIDMSSTVDPETIGVAMSISYPSFTGLFGTSRTITDKFAMRLEPSGSLGGVG